MSRYTTQPSTISRLISHPVVMVLLVLTVLLVTSTPARAADPQIQRVRGIDFGATINGRTNINVSVTGEPDRVVFALTGPVSRTAVRREEPYCFLRNGNGAPRFWPTNRAPEGDYSMQIRAIKDGQITDSVTINFTIDHSEVKQQTLPRKERVRTDVLDSDNSNNNVSEEQEIVVPSSGSSEDQSSGDDAKRSTQPVITFDSSNDDVYEIGSGEVLDINVQGQIPNNGDILAIAWDHDRRAIVDAFAHLVDKNNPVITSDKLDLLPEGKIQVQLLYREKSVIQYKKLYDVQVVSNIEDEDIIDEAPQIVPTKIMDVGGVQEGAVLTGKVQFEVAVSGDTPEEVIFNISGPDDLTYIADKAPYVMFGSGNSWDTSKFTNGQYMLTVTTLLDGNQTDSRTIHFTVNNVVTIPDPVVKFPGTTPDEYRLGEGINIPFTVDGQIPENADILVLAWSSATWGMVNEFAHYKYKGDSFVISADKMELIQPGRTQLQLLYQVDNKLVYKRTHDLQVLAPYGSETVDDSVVDSGDNGTDSGNSGSIDDNTTDTGSTDDQVADNGGDSGTDTGSDSGSGSGSNDSTADSGDSGSDNVTAPDTVVNMEQSPLLGMNLSFVTYWTREWVFTDVLRQSANWTSTNTGGQPYDAGREIVTDSNGWPILQNGEAASKITMNGHDGRYPGGKYICTYEGEGDIVFGWDASNGASQPGRIEVNVNPTNSGIYMRIENSNPNNHVRNVKLIHEDQVDHPSSFHPMFVEKLKPFKTLRFMDWQRTNTTDQQVWSDRVTPDWHTQGERGGVSIELMIELCNELGADPWFCMPADADDDYVRRFAQMVKNRLHKDGTVYVEWSNEVWNSQFEVHKWIKNVTSDNSFSNAFFDMWANNTKRDFVIWKDVWSNEPDRVVCVAASQAANVWVTKNLVSRLDGTFDAVSCSTYFGIPYNNNLGSGTTAGDLIDIMTESIVTDNRKYYTEHADVAKNYSEKLGRHIKLIAYEGGQHLADGGLNKPYKDALIAAQDHPKMYDLYLQNMLEFERAGGSANVLFNYVGRRDKWGSWGHLRYQDEPVTNSLKMKAVLDYPGSDKRLELTTFD